MIINIISFIIVALGLFFASVVVYDISMQNNEDENLQ